MKTEGMKKGKMSVMRKSSIAEAKVRRKVNKNWKIVEAKRNYKSAAVWQASGNATAMIQNECFDGILLQLNERNDSKSYNTQKRILRRIVEKRQAQSIHRALGRTEDRFATSMRNRSISRSVSDIRRFQYWLN